MPPPAPASSAHLFALEQGLALHPASWRGTPVGADVVEDSVYDVAVDHFMGAT